MEKIIAPKGTYDIPPEKINQWHSIEALLRQIFGEYGYRELRTPIFEYTELFQRGIGETTDIVEKEMFTFTDRASRSLTLRPEGTASVVRAYLEHNLAGSGIISKLYYYGPMFRCEAPQAGRFRQFTQFGAEVLGSDDPRVDAEIITLAMNIYRRLGINDLDLNLNSIGCTDCRPLYRQRLIEHLRPKASNLCPNCQRRLERNPLRLLDCKNPNCQKLTADVPVITETLCDNCNKHFQSLLALLDLVGIQYHLNPRLIRGLDYYTRTVFEILAGDLGAQNALGGGGRYDGLIEECGGDPTPGIGFAAGMERLLMVLEARNLLPGNPNKLQLFIAPLGEAAQSATFPIVIKLREAGWIVETDFQGRSLKSQMKLADKLGAVLVGVIGDNELANSQILIRKMNSSEQETIALNELEGFLGREFA